MKFILLINVSANNCWQFNIYEQDNNTGFDEINLKISFIFAILIFISTQFSMKSFLTSGPAGKPVVSFYDKLIQHV